MSPLAGYIAILDDDASLRTAMARLLQAFSMRVQTYGTAREFIDSLRLQVPACLIVDLQLEGMTGLELQHYLAGTEIKIPTIILTALDTPGMRERCLKAGAVDFLVKPVDKDRLLRTIMVAVGQNGRLPAL
jgi:FixJ family two-component response regulator